MAFSPTTYSMRNEKIQMRMNFGCCLQMLINIHVVVVNHESRDQALRFYHVKLRVHRCPPDLKWKMSQRPREAMDEAMNELPESPSGLVYIRPEQDTVLYNMKIDSHEDWPVSHLVGINADISATIREKFRHVWCKCFFTRFPAQNFIHSCYGTTQVLFPPADVYNEPETCSELSRLQNLMGLTEDSMYQSSSAGSRGSRPDWHWQARSGRPIPDITSESFCHFSRDISPNLSASPEYKTLGYSARGW